jgi:hypothetical protein
LAEQELAGLRRRKILKSPLWQNDSSSVKKLLTFMSKHTADIAGLYIPCPI